MRTDLGDTPTCRPRRRCEPCWTSSWARGETVRSFWGRVFVCVCWVVGGGVDTPDGADTTCVDGTSLGG